MQRIDERTSAILSACIILAVNIAALFGVSLDQGTLTNVAFGLAAIVADVYAIWKNHNFTPEAQQAQQVLNQLKGKE